MEYVRPVLECLRACFSCKDDTVNQGTEPNERTHLLVDPVSNSPAVRRTASDDLKTEYANSLPQRDEQTALNRIVQDTATNIIDVAAMDTHNLEPQEFNDRIKSYSQKLAQQWSNLSELQNGAERGLLKDIPNPEQMLASPSIDKQDLEVMRSFVERSAAALDEIKIAHKEDLVVPFRIP